MRRINEIFYSLQGEGYHTGIPAVFVRFSGCNLRCPFCDTQHEEGTLMSDEDIVMEVAKYSTQVVILTGGEPGLWIDEKLVDALHHEGKYVCIETNGTCLLPENIDWVTCSPKEGAKINLDRIDEVKVVYVGQDVSAYLDLSASHYFLQPCSCARCCAWPACRAWRLPSEAEPRRRSSRWLRAGPSQRCGPSCGTAGCEHASRRSGECAFSMTYGLP